MERLLLESAVRAILITMSTAVALWTMRIKSAAALHRVWSGVVVLMLALPLWTAWGPHPAIPVLPPLSTYPERPADSIARRPPVFIEETSNASPAAGVENKQAPVQTQPKPLDFVLIIYLTGAAVMFLRLAMGMAGTSRLRRRTHYEDGRLTSPDCLSPITIGLLRPVTVLPDEWQGWPQRKLEAVLAHENEHARRHDPLFQCLALLNRAVFWFHPLAWWLERRLSVLSEEACDAAVIEHGHDPEDYSGYLLDLARSVMNANGRLKVLGVAMPGNSLPQRIRKILHGIRPQKISRPRIVFTATICVVLSIPLATATLAHTLVIPMPFPALLPYPPPGIAATEKTVEVTTPVATIAELTPRPIQAPAPAPLVPRFEVASVKPCEPPRGGRGGPGQRGGGPGTPVVSPGRLNLVCSTVKQLIQQAFVTYAGGRRNSLLANPITFDGAPDWIDTARYEINATTADPSISLDMMRGPMMQALLEERFKLSVHRETKEIPVYLMTVLKSGLKAEPVAEGDCDPPDETSRPAIIRDGVFTQILQPGQKPSCGVAVRTAKSLTEPVVILIGQAMTLKEFAGFLGGGMDRPVIDNTAIKGIFNFRLQFAKDQATAGFLPPPPPGVAVEPPPVQAAEPAGPSIFTAIQEQVGLKLDQGRGPGQFLVIDHVERPTEN